MGKLEAMHAQEQLDLRQRQLGEVNANFEKFGPSELLDDHLAAQAKRQEEEVAAFKDRMDRERMERVEALKKEQRELADRLQRENEKEIRRVEAEHEARLEVEKAAVEVKMRERRAEMLKQQQAAHEKEMESMGEELDRDRKAAMMKQFEADRRRIQVAMEMERDRQNNDLETILTDKRQKRRVRQQRRMDEQLKTRREEMEKQIAIVNERANEAKAASTALTDKLVASLKAKANPKTMANRWLGKARKATATRALEEKAMRAKNRAADRMKELERETAALEAQAAKQVEDGNAELERKRGEFAKKAQEKAQAEEKAGHSKKAQEVHKQAEKDYEEYVRAHKEDGDRKRSRLQARLAAKKASKRRLVEAKDATTRRDSMKPGAVAMPSLGEDEVVGGESGGGLWDLNAKVAAPTSEDAAELDPLAAITASAERRKSTMLQAGGGGGGGGGGGVPGVPLSMASGDSIDELNGRLDAIERQVRAILSGDVAPSHGGGTNGDSGGGGGAGGGRGASTSLALSEGAAAAFVHMPFHDKVEDSMPTNEGTLRVLHANELPARRGFRFRFAEQMLDTMNLAAGFDQNGGARRVTMVPVAALPVQESNMGRVDKPNAFAKSYSFDAEMRKLYVRQERLDDAGELIVLLAHAMAHIQANPHDLSNDNDPRFIQHFFQGFRACGSGLFQKASDVERKALRVATGQGGGTSTRANRGAPSTPSRGESKDDSTTPRVNMDPAGDATDDIDDPRYFNLMSLKQRTAKYSAFLNRPALTAYMDQLEVPSLDGTPDHRRGSNGRGGNGNGGAPRSALGGNPSSSSSFSSSSSSSKVPPLGGNGSFGDSSGSIETKLGGGGGGDGDGGVLQQQFDKAESEYHATLQKCTAIRRAQQQLLAARKEHEQALAAEGMSEEDERKHEDQVRAIRGQLKEAEAALREADADKSRMDATRKNLKRQLDGK